MDRKKFLVTMEGLQEMYRPDKEISMITLEMYYNIFKKYDTKIFSHAIEEVIKIHKFNTLPTPSKILSFIENNPEEKSLIAWNKIVEARNKAGYYNSVVFDDKLIHHCINDLGGWMWLCEQYTDNLPFIEKRFRALYDIYIKRNPENKIEKLIGFTEAQNTKRGFDRDIPEPIRIGFKERKLLK